MKDLQKDIVRFGEIILFFEITGEIVNYVKRNLLGMIKVLYETGEANLFTLDTSMEPLLGRMHSGAPNIGRTLDILKGEIFAEASSGRLSYPYRLTRKVKRALDRRYT